MDSATQTPLSDRELIFAEAYLIKPCKAYAARKAGSPTKSAKEQGYEIYNRPHVKSYIEAKIKNIVLSGDEAVKLVSDIAQSNLTDYYVPVKTVKVERVEVKLAKVIEEKKEYILREEMYCERMGLSEDAFDKFQEGLNYERSQVVRLEIELERNPKAYRIMETEAKIVSEMQLDVNMLVADKDKGKIKKIKYGPNGLEVEGYSALEAARDILKINGKYEKDNSQKKPDSPVVNIRVIQPNDDE